LTQAFFPPAFGRILCESFALDTTQLAAVVLYVELWAELLADELSGRYFLVADIEWVWILTEVVHKAVVEGCFMLLSHVTENTVFPDFPYQSHDDLLFFLAYSNLFLAVSSHIGLLVSPPAFLLHTGGLWPTLSDSPVCLNGNAGA